MAEPSPSDPMPDTRQPQSHLFIVRLWWEPDDRGLAGEWRGSVEHIATREKRYFREPSALSAFVGERVGWQARLPAEE